MKRITDEEIDIDWTDDDGEPTDRVTLTRDGIYGLLNAQLQADKASIKASREKIAGQLFDIDWDEENGYVMNNATNGLWDEQTDDVFRLHYYLRADQIIRILSEEGVTDGS